MAVIFEDTLKKDISSKNTADTYLLFGDEDYLKDYYTKKLSAFIEDEVFNLQSFEGNCSLQDVYDAVMQVPLFSDKKCVILSDYDFEHASKSDFDKLCSLLSSEHEETVLILNFHSTEVDYKKSAKAKKIIAAAEKGGGRAVALNRRGMPELIKMLTGGAIKRGCKMSSDVARYLIETSGNDILTLRNELEKLCCYKPGENITKEIIDLVSVKTAEASVYNLAKEIFTCNSSGALAIIDTLFYMRLESNVIVHTLAMAYVDMYRVYLGKKAGKSISEICEQFGYKGREFVLNRAADNLRKFDLNKLSLSFNALYEADRLLKSNSDGRIVTEQLVIRLIYIVARGEAVDKT
ncbi:MAG: DNA polymerase III subunit delta [Clostridia bacterium]|nr:DNA polymerase III subunit delta [Clostridia bacterium]